MSFLKKIFKALTSSSVNPDSAGLYVYIKIRRTGEIVQVRLNRGNEISQDDEGRFFVRKMVMGQQSFDRIEATIYFDQSFRVKNAEIAGGELSTRADYLHQNPTAD